MLECTDSIPLPAWQTTLAVISALLTFHLTVVIGTLFDLSFNRNFFYLSVNNYGGIMIGTPFVISFKKGFRYYEIREWGF